MLQGGIGGHCPGPALTGFGRRNQDSICVRAGDDRQKHLAVIFARVVTSQRLASHSWIAVDAAFGAVPAGGDLIGLAVHDADDAGLVAGEAALTQVHQLAGTDAFV